MLRVESLEEVGLQLGGSYLKSELGGVEVPIPSL